MRAKRLAKIIELAEILHEPVEHECLRPLMAPTQKEELKGDKSLASPQTHNSGSSKLGRGIGLRPNRRLRDPAVARMPGEVNISLKAVVDERRTACPPPHRCSRRNDFRRAGWVPGNGIYARIVFRTLCEKITENPSCMLRSSCGSMRGTA